MILVTGGLGYIGSHTVVELMLAGQEILVVDNLSNSQLSVLVGIEKIVGKKPHFLQFDLRNKMQTLELNRNYAFEGCIHFAASKAVGEGQHKPLEYYENNIESLLNVLQLQIPNFIFSSSCTVYGQANELPITEQAPIKKAESVYGATKQIGEQIVKDYSELLHHHAILLRYFNPIGAHPSIEIGELPIGIPNNLVPFIAQTAAGIRKKLAIFGKDYPTPDGTAIRDYIYVVDLAKAHVKALMKLMQRKQDQPCEVYNLGTGKGNSVLEVVDTFKNINKVEVPYYFADRREGDITAAFADPLKANTELDWQADTPLEDSLKTAWEWQKKCLAE